MVQFPGNRDQCLSMGFPVCALLGIVVVERRFELQLPHRRQIKRAAKVGGALLGDMVVVG